jgi:ATP-binding cassette, subfamily C (CFTR/MRP), member 1
MIELEKGATVTDSIDISTLPRETVRQRLNAMPQDPCFLFGTVRLNLDPYQRVADSAMAAALTKMGL